MNISETKNRNSKSIPDISKIILLKVSRMDKKLLFKTFTIQLFRVNITISQR